MLLKFRPLVIGLLASATVVFAGEPVPRRIEVVFLAGQSNADGRAPSSALPPVLRGERNDIIFYSHTHGEKNNPDGTLGRIGPLAPGRTQFPAGAFGPEIALGAELAKRSLAKTQTTYAIVKYAKGGSSLFLDWRPGGDGTETGDGPHYRVFQRVVRDAITAIRARHPDAELHLAGLVWVQGETDADTDAAALAYRANLISFIADVRATMRDPGLPVIIARLSANQLALSAPSAKSSRRHQQVREAQTGVASAKDGIHLVDTDSPGFTFLNDRLHYDTAGQTELGTACAAALP